mgnify:FL=1|jgi:hypothetical protein
MMDSLLERLKPFIKENLEKDKDKYPSSYNRVITDLSNNIIVSDVEFGTLTTLSNYTNGKYQMSILDLYNMFE